MRTKRLSTNGDLPAVGLVGNAVDLLDVVRVGDDLVVGDDVLQGGISKKWARHGGAFGGLPEQSRVVCGAPRRGDGGKERAGEGDKAG
jgi:hypothetical protein